MDARFVVIIENTRGYEVIGWDNGVEIITAERDAQGEDGWLIVAESQIKEINPPFNYLVNGSLTDTRLEIIDLFSPPIITEIILAGTSNSGLILKSTDLGLTFTSEGSEGLGNPTCFCQLANGDILYGTDVGYVINYTQGTNILLELNRHYSDIYLLNLLL